MKILFYNHTNRVSGAERVLLLILAQLNRSCFASVLVCPAGGELQKEAKALDVHCAEIGQLNARFTWQVSALAKYFASFISVIRELRLRIREHQPDLIHANSIRAGLVVSTASIGLKVPVIWHVHDLLPNHPLSTVIRSFALIRPPQQVIVVANTAADRFKGNLLRWFPSRVRVMVVHNAVAIAKPPENSEQRSIRKELRVRNTDRLIGIVGNLSPVKGQLEMIRAFAEARKTNPNLAFVIVGAALFNQADGYEKQLSAEVRALGLKPYVRFLGQRSDVPAIMRALDLLVMNSRSEACPLVALEAMALGVPVLATAVGGVPELITHAQNGWLVPLGDKEKLVAGISLLLEKPGLRADLASSARERVAHDFPVHKFMSGVESAYAKAIAKPAQSANEKLGPLTLETN